MIRRVRGDGLARVLSVAADAGTHDAARLTSRRRPVRASRLAVAVDLHDDEEPDVPALEALRQRAEAATTRVEMLRAAAELGLYAGQVSMMAADAEALDGQVLDTRDAVEACALAAEMARKAGG